MRLRRAAVAALVAVLSASGAWSQTPASAGTSAPNASEAPLPDPRTLLLDVERNDKRMEALRRDYTYHVHLQQQELDKGGAVKKQETSDAESLTVDGVRVDRVVARNGKPLTPDEQAKESARIDKVVAKAKERREKATAQGETTDDRGDAMLSAGRILELGRFTNERRVLLHDRPTIVLDYTGDPGAKTHSQAEEIVRDLVGTVWIDEADHVLVRGEGHFLNNFKIGGGLIADVRKSTAFQFDTVRVTDGVWLPATITGSGTIRLLLFAGFNGRIDLQTSDYRRFHTSATILPGQTKVDSNGEPVPSAVTAPSGAGNPAQPQ